MAQTDDDLERHLSANSGSLLTAAEAVVAAITQDEHGAMVGGQWVGGNGGLLSRETLRKVELLRRELSTFRDKRSPVVAPGVADG